MLLFLLLRTPLSSSPSAQHESYNESKEGVCSSFSIILPHLLFLLLFLNITEFGSDLDWQCALQRSQTTGRVLNAGMICLAHVMLFSFSELVTNV